MAILLAQVPTAETASGVSAVLQAQALNYLAVDINVSTVTGTTPSCTFVVERQGADGNWYAIWTSSAVTAAGSTSTSIGPGCATDQVFTSNIRLRWTITGTTPSFTFSASIIGK
jgi:hypothetical protein